MTIKISSNRFLLALASSWTRFIELKTVFLNSTFLGKADAGHAWNSRASHLNNKYNNNRNDLALIHNT